MTASFVDHSSSLRLPSGDKAGRLVGGEATIMHGQQRRTYKNRRRPVVIRSILAGAALALCAVSAFAASAEAYPTRSVRVLVGLAPGGGTDTVGRTMTQKLSDVLGQSFVVDNRPSAGGNIAGELAANATPDGHTLIVVTPTHVVNPSLYKNLRYDAIKDFAP